MVSARLGDEICLRGGTALNLGFLNMPRLSVDVDLDYVGSADAAEARRRRPELLPEVMDLAGSLGYVVAEERASYAMAHLRLGCIDSRGRPLTLRVDLNFLDRVPVLTPIARRLHHPFGDDLATPAIPMLRFPEQVASKLVALIRRQLARDLLDPALIARRTAPDVDVVRTALVRRPCPVPLGEAQAEVERLLRAVLAPQYGHRAFLEALADDAVRPEMVPLDGGHARVRANPALRWRLQAGATAVAER